MTPPRMKRIFTLLLLLTPLAALHAAAPTVFNITTYGARSDSKTINTSAIQKAIDACHASGGGTVLVPEGVFVTGSVRLKSRVTLKIAKDAILRGLPPVRMSEEIYRHTTLPPSILLPTMPRRLHSS